MEGGMLSICYRDLLTLHRAFSELHLECRECPPSRVNLEQYLILRRSDHRRLQENLFQLGLSSLARSQASIGHAIEKAIQNLQALMELPGEERLPSNGFLDPVEAGQLLSENAARVFGGPIRRDIYRQRTHIMVTLPSSGADDNGLLIHEIGDENVDLFRINTAHDNPGVWRRMADVINTINNKRPPEFRIRIFTDLAGPKIRTRIPKGSISPEQGDLLWITAGDLDIPDTDKNAFTTLTGKRRKIHTPGCTSPEALNAVKEGDRIYFDDGKFFSRVLRVREEGVLAEITASGGGKLKDNKGINFPDTELDIPGFTREDRDTVASLLPFANIIGISFTRNGDDVHQLAEMLRQNNRTDIAIAAKLETFSAIRNLPEILAALIDYGSGAVMIARGDLALEVGFENLPYIQEEILDICTAAHIPVILATQVLETAMKSNIPSRAEVIDAAMASRADCIMLNKGNFTVPTIRTLKIILQNMHRVFARKQHLMDRVDFWQEIRNDGIRPPGIPR